MKAIASMLLLGLMAIGCQQASGTSDVPQIIIASDMPISGFESEAPQWERAIGWAISQQGSIGGFQLSYWSLDDALGAGPFQSRGLENVKRMEANRWVLGMVGASSSHVTLVALPEANLASLAYVSSTNTGSCLTYVAPGCNPTPAQLRPTGVNNFFRIAARDPLQGTAMARYVTTKRQVRRVAVFNEWGSDGDTYIDNFAAELGRDGGHIVYRQDLDQASNFVSFLTQARAQKADAVYAVGYSDVCAAAPQMKELLPGAILMGTDGLDLTRSSCFTAAGGPAGAEGIIATKPEIDQPASGDQHAQDVVNAFRKAYPKPTEIAEYTLASYDCARILIEAIDLAIRSNGGKYPSRQQVVAALSANTFVGVTGTYRFDANGDAEVPMMSMHQVQNGRWVDVPL
jgi:branched-chain amino acid transport system substrate-binding protein